MFNGLSKEKTIVCRHLSDLPTVAKEIIKEAGNIKVWLFEGTMGAGKTTLIKAISREYGIKDNVTSPTFSLVNEYEDGNGRKFYHFDFYRIEKESEAWDIGCDEYFYSGNICFIEWPSQIPNLIPEVYLSISIDVNQDQSRSIVIVKNGESV